MTSTLEKFKVAVFDQDRVSLMMGDSDVDPGICVAASYLWMNNRLNKPTLVEKLAAKRDGASLGWSDMLPEEGESLKARRMMQSFFKYTHRINEFYESFRPNDDSWDFEIVDGLLGGDIVKVRSRQQIQCWYYPPDEMEDIIASLHKCEAAIVGYDYETGLFGNQSAAGHAVALFRSIGNIIFFFDASCGAFMFEDHQRKEFLSAWAERSALGLRRIGSNFFFAVYRKA